MSPKFFGFLLLLVINVGCNWGSQNGPGLVTVTGNVRFKGEPIQQGVIGFSSPDGMRLYFSRISNGSYSLKAAQSVNGILPGEYRVSIQAWNELPDMKEGDNAKESAGVEAIPPKYFDPKTSGLTAEVSSKGGSIDFDLKP